VVKVVCGGSGIACLTP
ncbi:DUF3265 domain-containing protein, partial [Vibrio parahaemolyticus]